MSVKSSTTAARDEDALLINLFAGLDILTVTPEHQRRGAGRMLTKWGMDQADKLGADVCLSLSYCSCCIRDTNAFRCSSRPLALEFRYMSRWVSRPSEAS